MIATTAPTTNVSANASAVTVPTKNASVHTKRRAWTDLNSDAHCLPNRASSWQRAYYTTNVHTSLYMLNPVERKACYVVAVLLLSLGLLCTAVFVMGLVDGLREGIPLSSTVTAAAASLVADAMAQPMGATTCAVAE